MSGLTFVRAFAVDSVLTLSFMSDAVADDVGGGGAATYRSENAGEPRLELSPGGNAEAKVLVGGRKYEPLAAGNLFIVKRIPWQKQ